MKSLHKQLSLLLSITILLAFVSTAVVIDVSDASAATYKKKRPVKKNTKKRVEKKSSARYKKSGSVIGKKQVEKKKSGKKARVTKRQSTRKGVSSFTKSGAKNKIKPSKKTKQKLDDLKAKTTKSVTKPNFAKLSGKLRDLAKGKGNFGIGSGTRKEADIMGKAWVGNGYKTASDRKTLISKDGLRQYRPPSYKPRLGRTQANFEQRFPGQKTKGWQSNGHLDIKD